MISRSFRMVPLMIIAIAASAAAQLTPVAAALDREAAERITELSAGLHFSGAGPSSRPSDADLVKVTGRVHAELDDYVATAFKATDDPNAIQARLRNVLADHRPNPEYGDLPLARVAKLGGSQSLIVAYTLVRGPHDDIATIRGYRWNLDRFELASTTGDEFLGYDMFESILRSPNSNEFWLIAWGQAHTFNGKKVRFRIYSFDGNAFRTVWSPEDVFNASLHVTDSGFVIDSEVPHSPYEIHDNYLLTLNGPVKTN